jgi:hypothetical protein
MIRNGKKLSGDILRRIPAVIAKMEEDKNVVALYTFGSLAKQNLTLNQLFSNLTRCFWIVWVIMDEGIKEHLKRLNRYYLQALLSLDEATFLLSGEKGPHSIINRVYYAMFCWILALLIYDPYSSSKDSGVLGYFNWRFIK